jgi:hypothetical protein
VPLSRTVKVTASPPGEAVAAQAEAQPDPPGRLLAGDRVEGVAQQVEEDLTQRLAVAARAWEARVVRDDRDALAAVLVEDSHGRDDDVVEDERLISPEKGRE